MNELIKIEKDEQEINQISPLTWAYVGDCVFELYIRTKLINETKLKPHELHIKAINYVKAKAQAETLDRIFDKLNSKEREIARRGRNTENHHVAKNANTADYSHSTAFEAVIGYLYLTHQDERLEEVLNMCLEK